MRLDWELGARTSARSVELALTPKLPPYHAHHVYLISSSIYSCGMQASSKPAETSEDPRASRLGDALRKVDHHLNMLLEIAEGHQVAVPKWRS